MDKLCGLNEVKKKNIILPISDTLKYFENSHDNLPNEWNSNNLPIDIERQKNTTLLDVLNYHTFMCSDKTKNNVHNYTDIVSIYLIISILYNFLLFNVVHIIYLYINFVLVYIFLFI